MARLIAAHGHTLGPVADEAWTAFGPPTALVAHQDRGATWIEWRWDANPSRATDDHAYAATAARIDAWSPFVARHDQLQWNDDASSVGLRCR